MSLTRRHGFALPGALLPLALTAPTWPARAETVTGRLFHDLKGDGIRDPGARALDVAAQVVRFEGIDSKGTENPFPAQWDAFVASVAVTAGWRFGHAR